MEISHADQPGQASAALFNTRASLNTFAAANLFGWTRRVPISTRASPSPAICRSLPEGSLTGSPGQLHMTRGQMTRPSHWGRSSLPLARVPLSRRGMAASKQCLQVRNDDGRGSVADWPRGVALLLPDEGVPHPFAPL